MTDVANPDTAPRQRSRTGGLRRMQNQVSAAWQDIPAWTRMSIRNTASSGVFSPDRAIAEYCDDIWNVFPVTVRVD
jgi:hypothetical protein